MLHLLQTSTYCYVGIPATQGAAMLSVLLGCAFVSRQFWGCVADRIGGLRTVLAGSACQIAAMVGFLLTQNEAGLFAVAAVFGLGFSGIIPAYVLAVRELFPAAEASWRMPTRAAVQRFGDGGGRLARRRDLRPFRLLCRRLRHRHRVQPRQPDRRRRAGMAPGPVLAATA